MAETFTENLKLSKRDTGDLNWGAGANANLEVLDKHAQMKVLRPPRTLLASLGSGAVGANLVGTTTYFYKVVAVNAAGETTENQIPAVFEAQVTQPTVPVPVLLQWETVKGATGYKIYKSAASGQEKFLASVSGEATSIYTDDGNTAVNAGVSVPTVNTARLSVSKVSAGAGISVSPADGTGDVQVDNAGVAGLRKIGEASPLVGDVKLEAGTGVTLTQDGPNNKIVIAASGGSGPAGYATVVVAAPSGAAATDTANIQAALNTAGTAGGGRVVLREGTYKLNAALSIPANVTLQGQGRDATTLLADPGMSNISMIDSGGNANVQLLDLTVDANQPNRTGGSPNRDVNMEGSDVLIENCHFIRNMGTAYMLALGLGAGTVRNCVFDINGGSLFGAMVGQGRLVTGCLFRKNHAGGDATHIVNAFIIQDCHFIRQNGTSSFAVINPANFGIVMGNIFDLSTSTLIAITTGSSGKAYVIVGNRLGDEFNTAKIRIRGGVTKAVVVGNSRAEVLDESGNTTNQILGNTF
ncbi:MAG: right-handed parallel beta-helix repeat-containing protein [Elusimicrobia bacterium]|nr:right-handed parallel beta-helix repeat-containing protein [Elusimicrobiota bacterium]